MPPINKSRFMVKIQLSGVLTSKDVKGPQRLVPLTREVSNPPKLIDSFLLVVNSHMHLIDLDFTTSPSNSCKRKEVTKLIEI